MARFINNRKAVSEIEDLIKNAGEKLVLMSPYLKLSKDFKELLKYRNDDKEKTTTIVFGKQELNPEEIKFLKELRLVILKYHEDLHAKCYYNEEKMIITSLNLYEFSMNNNKEMGVLIDRNEETDKQLYEEGVKEADYIMANSQRFELGSSSEKYNREVKPASSKESNEKTGFCIRTGVTIPFNVERPLSYNAFKKWNEFGDTDYAEKFCHFSGEPSNGETSVSRPILKKNWKKAKEIFNL